MVLCSTVCCWYKFGIFVTATYGAMWLVIPLPLKMIWHSSIPPAKETNGWIVTHSMFSLSIFWHESPLPQRPTGSSIYTVVYELWCFVVVKNSINQSPPVQIPGFCWTASVKIPHVISSFANSSRWDSAILHVQFSALLMDTLPCRFFVMHLLYLASNRFQNDLPSLFVANTLLAFFDNFGTRLQFSLLYRFPLHWSKWSSTHSLHLAIQPGVDCPITLDQGK